MNQDKLCMAIQNVSGMSQDKLHRAIQDLSGIPLRSVNPIPQEKLETTFDVETYIENQRIISEVTQKIEDHAVNTMQTVIDLQDAQVRDKLIALGWTPPANAILEA